MYPPHCLRYFKEPQIVKAVLPVGDQPLTLNSRVRLFDYPYLEGFFPPDRLPMYELELGNTAFFHCRTSVGIFIIRAILFDILDERRLRFTFVDSAPPVQKRQHFRIDTEVYVSSWKKMIGELVVPADLHPVNLSGGGIRFSVPEPLPEDQELILEIGLPKLESLVRCEARVVRMMTLAGSELQAACQYTDIYARDVDLLTSFCLEEQRRRLREKVRI